jgi:hypothetical protein
MDIIAHVDDATSRVAGGMSKIAGVGENKSDSTAFAVLVPLSPFGTGTVPKPVQAAPWRNRRRGRSGPDEARRRPSPPPRPPNHQ